MTSEQLKAARAKLGLTQPAIAKLIGQSPRAYQDWEGGAAKVPGPAARLIWLMVNVDGVLDKIKNFDKGIGWK